MRAFARLFGKSPEAPRDVGSVSRSHVGRIRKVNEDRVLDRPDLALWAVADGMGGHSAGDVAAETAIAELERWGERRETPRLNAAMLRAHARVLAVTGGKGGTTLVAMAVAGGEAHICWAGDSRAYLIRAGRLRQLTRDHSLVQQLLDAGLIDASAARTHPQANVVTSALGTGIAPLIESITIPIAPGDRVLLCSDGVSRSLRDDEVAGDVALPVLADGLIAAALDRDGSDNASLVLVRFS